MRKKQRTLFFPHFCFTFSELQIQCPEAWSLRVTWNRQQNQCTLGQWRWRWLWTWIFRAASYPGNFFPHREIKRIDTKKWRCFKRELPFPKAHHFGALQPFSFLGVYLSQWFGERWLIFSWTGLKLPTSNPLIFSKKDGLRLTLRGSAGGGFKHAVDGSEIPNNHRLDGAKTL